MKLRKVVKNPLLIECPYCGCKPSEGFDCEGVDEFDNDEFCRDVYVCPKCHKKSVRCYQFYAWENDEGDEMETE